MNKATTINPYVYLASFFLPNGILDWFDMVRVDEDTVKNKQNEDELILHLYLDELDNRPDGDNLEHAYKNHLSGFRSWEQKEHAQEWMLLEKNMGERLSIDETSLCGDLFTFLSNKDGHGRQGSIIAAVRGTKASEVLKILMQIPQEKRLEVRKVTMNFSDSMYSIVRQAFPNATIVIDCFHIMKRCGDALEEIRMRFKRAATTETRKEERVFKERLKRNAEQRKRHKIRHPKNYKGKKRGRKPARKNEKYTPKVLSNGDSKVELLTRSRYLLLKSREKWSPSQKKRAEILIELYPKLKQGYDLTNELRSIFKNKSLNKNTAKEKLHAWYKTVSASRIKKLTSARNTLKSKKDEVLNYFINRATNAAAKSLNAKIKEFRAQLRGVSDLPFFMYRLSLIFG